MFCERCGITSRVLSRRNGLTLRECVNHHRWQTSTVEIRQTDATEPATAETVLALKLQGESVRAIAAQLLMSTATVQQHLAGAPTLEGVWQ